MTINIEYQEISCIHNMDLQYQEKFNEIVKQYAPKLPDKILLDNSAFTLHDFNNHCIDIYKIISEVLLYEELAYDENHGLTQKELFILNLAVLFHDIGMDVLGANRKKHSLNSAQYLEAEYADSRSVFRQVSKLTKSEFYALKAIIIAHSDVKDGTVTSEENGLNSPQLCNHSAHPTGQIRTKFLAGILRIADELDVSSDRIGTGDIVQQIKEGKSKLIKIKKTQTTNADTEAEIKQWEGYIESLEYWEKLQYIINVKRENKKIILKIDDDYVQNGLDESKTVRSIANELVDIQRKIEKELNVVLNKAIVGIKEKNIVPVESVSLKSENPDIESEVHDLLSVMQLEEIPDQTLVDENHDYVKNKKSLVDIVTESIPVVLDKELEKLINEEVNNRKMIKFGHFILNNNFCARDWIDTKDLVETKLLLDKIVEVMVKHINTNQLENYIIIGIDLVGSLLASKIAFALQKPFSYIIPAKEEGNSAEPDIKVEIDTFEKIILITDAIVTYDTIKTAIQNYNLEERLYSIYTIFYRKNDDDKAVDYTYTPKTYSTNNSFNIELFKKDKCQYNKEACIAINRKSS